MAVGDNFEGVVTATLATGGHAGEAARALLDMGVERAALAAWAYGDPWPTPSVRGLVLAECLLGAEPEVHKAIAAMDADPAVPASGAWALRSVQAGLVVGEKPLALARAVLVATPHPAYLLRRNLLEDGRHEAIKACLKAEAPKARGAIKDLLAAEWTTLAVALREPRGLASPHVVAAVINASSPAAFDLWPRAARCRDRQEAVNEYRDGVQGCLAAGGWDMEGAWGEAIFEAVAQSAQDGMS